MKKARLLLPHRVLQIERAKVAARAVHYHTTLGESYFFNSISASFASGSVIFSRILASEGTAPAKAAPSGRVPLTQNLTVAESP